MQQASILGLGGEEREPGPWLRKVEAFQLQEDGEPRRGTASSEAEVRESENWGLR